MARDWIKIIKNRQKGPKSYNFRKKRKKLRLEQVSVKYRTKNKLVLTFTIVSRVSHDRFNRKSVLLVKRNPKTSLDS